MRTVIVMLVALAGCATTPSEFRKEHEPEVSFDTAMKPRPAAQCLGRAAEEYPKLMALDQFHAEWREAAAPDAYEVLVRRTGSVTLLIADVAPAGDGSKVEIRQSVGVILSDPDLGLEMAKRCGARNLKSTMPE